MLTFLNKFNKLIDTVCNCTCLHIRYKSITRKHPQVHFEQKKLVTLAAADSYSLLWHIDSNSINNTEREPDV